MFLESRQLGERASSIRGGVDDMGSQLVDVIFRHKTQDRHKHKLEERPADNELSYQEKCGAISVGLIN